MGPMSQQEREYMRIALIESKKDANKMINYSDDDEELQKAINESLKT